LATRKPKAKSRAAQFSYEFKKRVAKMPRWLRITTGVVLLIGGVLGFLPILGFWMIPLGLLVLSREFHWARRVHTSILRLLSRWRRRKRNTS
jgi:hypothetical protein